MTDDHFNQASQEAARAVAEHGGIGGSEEGQECEKPRETRGLKLQPVGDTGSELPLVFSGNTTQTNQSNAESDALGAREALNDPDLLALIEAWPTLPEATRLRILDLIGAEH